MDPDQFDALVQRLIAAQNRRQALTGALGGALASLGITVVAESRRKRANGAGNDRANRKRKHRQQDHDHHGDQQGDGSAERLGRRNRKRKRDRHKEHKHDEKKKKKKRNQRKDRCKKNGQPCARDSKCCSKHCDPNTGSCTRKPAS